MPRRLTSKEIERLRKLKREHPETPKAVLAKRFGVNPRTIQRYWIAPGGASAPTTHDPYTPPLELSRGWPF